MVLAEICKSEGSFKCLSMMSDSPIENSVVYWIALAIYRGTLTVVSQSRAAGVAIPSDNSRPWNGAGSHAHWDQPNPRILRGCSHKETPSRQGLPHVSQLTGAIAAFGKVLELLTALQQPEELGPKPRRFLVATWLHDLGDEGGPVAVMPGPLRRR